MMEESQLATWPRPKTLTRSAPSLIAGELWERLRSPAFSLRGLLLLLLVAAYFALLLTPLPNANAAAALTAVEEAWWPWQFIDLLVTGGSLSRAGLMAAAGIAFLVSRRIDYGEFVGFVRPTRIEVVALTGVIALPTFLVQLALILLGVLSREPTEMLVTGLLMLAGSAFTLILAAQLGRRLQLNIFMLHALLILGQFAQDAARVAGQWDLPVLALLATLFLISYLVVRARRVKMTFVDRGTGLNEEADLILRYSGMGTQLLLLVMWALAASLILLLVGFFGGDRLDLASDTPVVPVVVLLSGAAIFWLIRRFQIAPYSVVAHKIAANMHKRLWIARNIRPGTETAMRLNQILVNMARHWILFFLVWAFIFWAFAQFAPRFNLQPPAYPGGVLTLVIMLALVSAGLHKLWVQIAALSGADYRTGQFVNLDLPQARPGSAAPQSVEDLMKGLPDDVRVAMTELLTMIAEQGYFEVARKIFALSLRGPASAFRGEGEEIGSLGKELLFGVLHIVGLFAIILATFSLAGYQIGSNERFDILMAIVPAVYDLFLSGRFWRLLRLLLARGVRKE